MTEYHVLNIGAGVQSTRLALEFNEGAIFDRRTQQPVELTCAFFADTQDEPEAVYSHLNWLVRSGVTRYQIHIRTKGRLSAHLMRGENSTGQRFSSIPAFTASAGGSTGQTRRQCSSEYKIEVINRAIRRELCRLAPGRTVPKTIQVVQYFGISADETGRAIRIMRNAVPEKRKSETFHWGYEKLIEFFANRRWRYVFPLVDRDVTRAHCLEYLESRVPHQTPRSACVYCPYHDDAEWERIKSVPTDWALAVQVDTALRVKGNIVNRKMDQPMYLHRSCVPLELVKLNPLPPGKAQLSMNFSGECLGVCGN